MVLCLKARESRSLPDFQSTLLILYSTYLQLIVFLPFLGRFFLSPHHPFFTYPSLRYGWFLLIKDKMLINPIFRFLFGIYLLEAPPLPHLLTQFRHQRLLFSHFRFIPSFQYISPISSSVFIFHLNILLAIISIF